MNCKKSTSIKAAGLRKEVQEGTITKQITKNTKKQELQKISQLFSKRMNQL